MPAIVAAFGGEPGARGERYVDPGYDRSAFSGWTGIWRGRVRMPSRPTQPDGGPTPRGQSKPHPETDGEVAALGPARNN
jgi:hypothetical protein